MAALPEVRKAIFSRGFLSRHARRGLNCRGTTRSRQGRLLRKRCQAVKHVLCLSHCMLLPRTYYS